MQIWPALIIVKNATTNQRLSLPTQLDAVVGDDLLDGVCELERLGVDAVPVGDKCRHKHYSWLLG